MTQDLELRKELANAPEGLAEWEALCKGCGKCCYEKLEEEDGTVIYTDIPCPYLDPVENSCLVYANRFDYMPDCLSLREQDLENFYWLPDDCAYVEKIRAEKGPKGFKRKAPVIF